MQRQNLMLLFSSKFLLHSWKGSVQHRKRLNQPNIGRWIPFIEELWGSVCEHASSNEKGNSKQQLDALTGSQVVCGCGRVRAVFCNVNPPTLSTESQHNLALKMPWCSYCVLLYVHRCNKDMITQPQKVQLENEKQSVRTDLVCSSCGIV